MKQARPPEVVRINPLAGESGNKGPALVALEEELRRAMGDLGNDARVAMA